MRCGRPISRESLSSAILHLDVVVLIQTLQMYIKIRTVIDVTFIEILFF